ncbi:MAG: 4-hydroxythreonine-4-phosphate dehydrogenase PdxA [Gammaproteobacteria bacterium]|nr:4-hydroxythreonine-4-phosphate dehydrogenase PdxA [Gammaproteobacteria bacterium]
MNKPRLAITPGEPAGIGPDLVLQLTGASTGADLVVCADPDLLQSRAHCLGVALTLQPYTPDFDFTNLAPDALCVLPVGLNRPCIPGTLDVSNAPYVLQCLDRALAGCLAGEFSAMVTGPVQKSIINDAGIPFTGHTEYLAGKSGGHHPVMMLTDGELRVALVTTHLPLADVPTAIDQDLIILTVEIVHRAMSQQYGLNPPRILVCGLNPHAGESGKLGIEELSIINPALAALRARGMHIIGPVPADTAFTPAQLRQADVVVAMYHDQGLPVLKARGFGHAVNVTLGLPVTRTSVDHGTALDLAGSGRADGGSLRAAVNEAVRLSRLPATSPAGAEMPA